jgi:CCR4-NOT transcription complex subunit 1
VCLSSCDLIRMTDRQRKLNVPVTMTLVVAGMIAPSELDQRLSQMLLKNPSDPAEINFVTEIIRRVLSGEVQQATRKDFASTLTCMLKLEENGSAPRNVVDLLAGLKRGVRRISTSDNGELVVLDEKKQAQLKHFFLDWVRTYRSSAEPEKAFRSYVNYLHNEGILKGEDISAAFYKLAIQVAVDGDSGHSGQEGSFIGSDSFAKLMVLVVTYQYSNDRNPDLNRASYYFKKVVNILSFCLVERHMELGEAFDQKPWTRIFTTLLSELNAYQESHPPLYHNCLRILANAMGFTQPVYAPRFAFGWISIISHRLFMPRLLAQDIDNSWAEYHKCLMWLLRFSEPFLKASEMNHSSRSIYRGICRIFCVLVHDFPDFLEEYYHSFVTSIPPNCIQLRNIVLSAFPATESPLPDAHRGLERLGPEMQRIPTIRTDFAEALETGGIKAAIDAHVATGAPSVDKIVGELRSRIAVRSLPTDGPAVTWNRTLLHAAVYYLGTSCIGRVAERRGVVEFDTKAPELAILAHLAMSLDAEGKSIFMLFADHADF